ncbi:MAG: hypothetical protein KAT27_03495, partial [Desulfobacterales bacterium]|nr:hypothetical protein [Desulfobacterales bacterium]
MEVPARPLAGTALLLDMPIFVNYSGHKNYQQGDVMEDFQQILLMYSQTSRDHVRSLHPRSQAEERRNYNTPLGG